MAKPRVAAGSTLLRLVESFAGSFDDILAVDRADLAHLQATGLESTKIVCEVCLLFELAAASVSSSPRLYRQVQHFLRAAMEHVLRPEILAYIERTPSGVHLVGLVMLCARTYGLNCQHFCRLERALRSPAYLATERLPFRYEEALWLYRRLTGEPLDRPRSNSSLLLSRFSHPCVLRRDDLYALTHAAMYDTDFGRVPPRPEHAGEPLGLSIRHDLSFCYCNADWDLVGELCMTARFLGDWRSVDTSCFAALDAIFAQFGFIPSITFDAGHAAGLNADDLCTYRFVHSYHSSLVYAILLACCTPPEVSPASPPEGDVRAEEVVAAIDRTFGHREFDIGPLSQNWYANAVDVSLDTLVDGYATKCYRMFGREVAIAFIDSVHGAAALPLAGDTRAVFERI